MNRLRFDWIVLALVVVVGLRFAGGHGLWGWLIRIAVSAVLGGVLGLAGRRYPIIYRQNRRDRRRDRG